MAQLLVRKLDERVKSGLARRARRHRRSMEEEARVILAAALRDEGRGRSGLGTRIAARFQRFGLVDDVPELRGAARPARFDR